MHACDKNDKQVKVTLNQADELANTIIAEITVGLGCMNITLGVILAVFLYKFV